MKSSIQQVVIVGGGTAGWLSACVIAARRPDLSVTLVEAPNIPTIGVGEGTWPTMRDTLASIGIPETEFLQECDASFKQGSRFDGWVDGSSGDSYLHPFTPPPSSDMRDLLAAWRASEPETSFAAAMSAQHAACAHDLAPRQRAMPDYAATLNYGYHLDAGKFAALLTRHATTRLGVTHIAAEVVGIVTAQNGDIASLELRDKPAVSGDLFIDCSGHAAILIDKYCKVDWVDRSNVSFNNRALAVQVPVDSGAPIAAQTIGTAHRAGWLWDIALPTRRGIGCVYASAFMNDSEAEVVLRDYVTTKVSSFAAVKLNIRQLSFRTGHRAKFWDKNCLAIGLSAGFIEPLEASAIVLIELSLKALIDNFPTSREIMDIHAARFNELFRYRWDKIIDFLKLHYVLSRRDEPYWRAQRDPETIPQQLAQQLALWADQPPSLWDFPRVDEMFSPASQQYVLYGMQAAIVPSVEVASPAALARLTGVREKARVITAALPTNRAYFTAATAQTQAKVAFGDKIQP
jgi:tryptophan 7-halogenase